MPIPLYGTDREKRAIPVRVDRAGRLVTTANLVIWLLVILELAQLATLIVLATK